jgi:hypothetical protein
MSKDWIEDHYLNDNYESMRDLILRLQQKEYAESVFAFTSLYDFFVTLQNEYDSTTKDTIRISFDSRTKFFDISYCDVKSRERVVYRCAKNQDENLIDAFVLRVFLTENNEEIKFEAEERPSFQIGEQVETIPLITSRKSNRGKIFDIVKHHKKNRFIYFIEVEGKKLKKRYFKENLKPI